MMCKECRYKNNPPENRDCLYCGKHMPISRDIRKLKKFIRDCGEKSIGISSIYFGSTYVKIWLCNGYININIIPKLKSYLHAAKGYVMTNHVGEVMILEFDLPRVD